MSDNLLITKLKTIKDKIDDLQNQYNLITELIGYDLKVCPRCKGKKYYNKFTGNDCNGANYDLVECDHCVDGYVLEEIKKDIGGENQQ